MPLLNLLPVCHTLSLTATYLTGRIFFLIGIVGVVSNPMRGAWLSLIRMGARVVTGPFRAIRLAQGKQEVESACEGESQTVIDAFKLANRKDMEKARRKTMEERFQSVLTYGGAGTLLVEKKEEGAPDVPPPPPPQQSGTSTDQQDVMSPVTMGVDEEEKRFQKDLEEAIAASTRESEGAKGALNADGGDEQFERAMKMAMELSQEGEEFERGLMQEAGQTGGQVDALPTSKS
jgi:hypothetical protein